MKKEYTFEDWLEDTSNTYTFIDPETGEEITRGKDGNYPEYLFESGKISKEVFHEIRDAQRNAFRAVFEFMKKEIDDDIFYTMMTGYFKRYFKLRRKEIKKDIKQCSSDMLKAIYQGAWSAFRIDAVTYKEIIRKQQNGEKQVLLRGYCSDVVKKYGPHPDVKDLPKELAIIEDDEYLKMSVQCYELKELNSLNPAKSPFKKKRVLRSLTENDNELIGEKAAITKHQIFKKYHELYNNGNGMTQSAAYEQVENWLLKDLKLTREDIKKRFGFTLELEAFTRTARNNRFD